MIRLAKDGLGVAIIPGVLVQEDLQAGNLRMISVGPAFPPLEMQVSYLSDPQSRLQRLLSDILIEVGVQFCQESSPDLVWMVTTQMLWPDWSLLHCGMLHCSCSLQVITSS